MTAIDLVKRASVDAAAVLSVLAVVAGFAFGPPMGVGILAGGALAVVNLWWLARRAIAAAEAPDRNWPLGAVLRLGGVAAVAAIVLASGLAHPLGVVAGLTVLPFALLARGLRAS
jgi:hypothetical protein